MTETKHSQETVIALPEKKWFTLKEIADRWSRLTGKIVTVDDVLHFEDTGKLTIAGVFVTVVDLGESEALPITTLNDLTSVAAQLRAYGFVKHFIEGDHIDEAVINKHAGSLVSVMKYDGHRMSLPEHEIHIPINALCVSLDELERFEQARPNKPVPMQDLSAPDKLDPRWEDSLLRVIALLAAETGIPIQEPYKAAEILKLAAGDKGLDIPSQNTLAKIFNRINNP